MTPKSNEKKKPLGHDTVSERLGVLDARPIPGHLWVRQAVRCTDVLQLGKRSQRLPALAATSRQDWTKMCDSGELSHCVTPLASPFVLKKPLHPDLNKPTASEQILTLHRVIAWGSDLVKDACPPGQARPVLRGETRSSRRPRPLRFRRSVPQFEPICPGASPPASPSACRETVNRR